MKDEDLISEAKEAFELCEENERENRLAANDDIEFGRLGVHWDEKVRKQREKDGRPCLTVNLLPAAIRQVVNDARQNKPAIKVRPADDKADPETAEIYNGLIRNIEATSRAQLAYDRALESAVESGLGYFTINTKFADDDTFEMDLRIERVANPFTIYGDPYSMDADSSDWNTAFQIDSLTREQFQRRYKGAEEVDWSDYKDLPECWTDEDDRVIIARYWRRTEITRTILGLSDGTPIAEDVYTEQKAMYDEAGITVIGSRDVPSHKVKWSLMTGAEVLDGDDWAGKYIPIVPVYGEEVVFKGKRHFRSLIRDAKDAARMHDYWRTASTELVGLAPKAPWVGPEGSFDIDDGWSTANSENHSYLEYKGQIPPQRQPFAGVPAGALQEAINAANDVKAITGLHDASLGAPSNETSGRAIQLRQREGDVSSFHFIDNLTRGIEHGGRILLDLIPKVYTGERIIRVLGAEGSKHAEPRTVQINSTAEPQQQPQAQQGMDETAELMEAIPRIYNLTVGKYDLVVSSGPSFTTKREEAATGMIELIRAYPPAAPIVAPHLMKNLDWPGADEIAEQFEKMSQSGGEAAAEQAKAQAQIQLEQAKATANVQMQREQAMADNELAQMRAEADLRLQEQKNNLTVELERQKAGVQLQLKRDQGDAEIALKQREMEMQFQLQARAQSHSEGMAERKQAAAETNIDGPHLGGEPG